MPFPPPFFLQSCSHRLCLCHGNDLKRDLIVNVYFKVFWPGLTTKPHEISQYLERQCRTFCYEIQEDCIPVGCVPPACCPYLPACTVPRVSGRGGAVPGRGGAWSRGGVWSRRGEVYPSMQWGRPPPPCGQNSWHTLLKILPCPNFVAGGKNRTAFAIHHTSYLLIYFCLQGSTRNFDALVGLVSKAQAEVNRI